MVDKKAIEDFKLYAEGVKRLKELKNELDSLDTRRFKNEELSIRKKLKSVHMIPQIEREINELKARISGVDVGFLKSKMDFEQTRRITELEKRSEELERELALARRGLLTRQEVEDVEHFPALNSRVSYLREIVAKEDKELKKEIQKVKRKKAKKQLTGGEVKDVESIPSIKGKVAYLKKLLEIDEEKLRRLAGLKEKVELALSEARKKQLSGKELENVEAIPHLRGRVSYLRHLIGEDEAELKNIKALEPKIKAKIEKALKKAEDNKLSKKELSEINAIPHLRGKLSYLRHLIGEDERKISELEAFEPRIEDELEILRKKQLSGKELENVEAIPHLRGRVSYLRHLIGEDEAELKNIKALEPKIKAKIEKALKKAEDNKLSKKELSEINAIPHLMGKLSYLRRLITEDEAKLEEIAKLKPQVSRIAERIPRLAGKIGFLRTLLGRKSKEIETIETKTEKIPGIQSRISALARMLKEKSEQISYEAADIDLLKHKLAYFRRQLEEKEKEIEEEIRKSRDPNLKRRILHEVRELEGKVDSTREELYKKITDESSESKWMIQKQKEEIGEEIKKLAKASANIIRKENDEITKQLLEEVGKLNEKIEESKKEFYNNFSSRLAEMKKKMENLEMMKKRQEAEEYRKEHHILPRSKLLGIRPKFLSRIEHLDEAEEPKIIKEINLLAPRIPAEKTEKQKHEKKGEISELPQIPLSAEELKFLMPDDFRADYDTSLLPINRFDSSFGKKSEIDVKNIKKTMGHPHLKVGVCKAPCFLDEGNFNEISCPENLAIFSDPKLKTVKLLPHSKECGFKFMDIIKLIN